MSTGLGQSLQGGVGQSLISQGNLQSSLQSHLNLGGTSSPQSTLGAGSQNLFQHNKMNMGHSGFGSNTLGNLGQSSLSSHINSLGQNNMSQSLGQGGFNSLGQQGIGQQVLGQQVLGQQGLGQHSMNTSNPNFMGNFDQTLSNINQNHFPKDIEDEANSYFQQIIITKSIPINTALDMLKKFESSSDKREKDVFNCMLHALFEEYKFFNQYPEQELKITGKLFGGIIERGLVTYVSLGYALRIILDSLQFPPTHKMYMFGINAIEEFKHKLKDYPQYCRYLKEKNPHYKDFPPRLLEYIEHGEESQEPPSAKFNQQQPQQGFGTGALQQSSFQTMFGNQTNYNQNNQNLGMFAQSNSGGGSLFNPAPPSSSPHATPQMTSFNLQSILHNPASKGTIGSSLGNIGSSLGTNSFNLPPSSSPNILTHQAVPVQQNAVIPHGRSTPTRTVTPQGGWTQPEQDDKKVIRKIHLPISMTYISILKVITFSLE